MYEILSDLMKENNITPYRLAKETGITQATLSRWKSGKTSPSIETLQALADYFHVSVDYLLTGEEPEQKGKPLVNGDEELTEYLEELRTRPEMKMLFQLTSTATKEDVEKAVKIIETMLGK